MLRGRIVSANGIAAENIKPKDGRRLGAAKRPRHHLQRRRPGRLAPGRGPMVGPRLRRPAAGLVRKEDRRRARPQARRSDHRQRARPQHHRPHRQSAHRRLAEPRHQFRDGVFAQRLPRRAADASRHAHLSGRRHAGAGRRACIRAVADAFPMVTTVRVKEALEAIGAIVANLVLAIRGASAITLLAAALVLGGALAAGHRHRVYDAVILKTLGATRRAAARRLYDRIPAARRRHRAVRRVERLAGRLADRGRPHAPAASPGCPGRRWRRRLARRGHSCVRAGRHLHGAWARNRRRYCRNL